jgi:hypothetical protein
LLSAGTAHNGQEFASQARKLRSKIEEKRAAHGLKTDGSVYYYDPYNEEQSM